MRNTNPPLWEVMQAAYFRGGRPGFSEPHGYAAEIRALADWLVPEEPPISLSAINMRDLSEISRWFQRDERQRLRLDLLAEADEAEAGNERS
jgi:hypothetical protein